MREKPPKENEFERRRTLMRNSIGFIVDTYQKYAADDPVFYLDESTYDLYEREVFSRIYGPAAQDGWMSKSEEASLKELLKQCHRDWQVNESKKHKINYDHPEEDQRL